MKIRWRVCSDGDFRNALLFFLFFFLFERQIAVSDKRFWATKLCRSFFVVFRSPFVFQRFFFFYLLFFKQHTRIVRNQFSDLIYRDRPCRYVDSLPVFWNVLTIFERFVHTFDKTVRPICEWRVSGPHENSPTRNSVYRRIKIQFSQTHHRKCILRSAQNLKKKKHYTMKLHYY